MRPVSLCSAGRQAGDSSPALALSILRHQAYDYPFALKPRGISVFLLNGPIAAPLLDLRREGSPSLHSLMGWGKNTAHTVNALGRNHLSPSDPSTLLNPKGAHELTDSGLEHPLCKRSTCGLASHFEIW